MVMRYLLLLFLVACSADIPNSKPWETLPESAFVEQAVIDEDSIRNVDRREYLENVVRSVTSGTDREKVIQWVTWLQNHFAHPQKPPIYENGIAIYDPVWLIENQLAHCGQVNRLVVDGLNLIGIKSRLIQLNNHVAAEAYFDGKWRFLDADILSFGEFVMKDGEIVSTMEIVNNPELLNATNPLLENTFYPDPRLTGNEMATYKETFSTGHYPDFPETPFVWKKTATPEQEQNIYYGWNYYEPTEYKPANSS